MGAMAVAIAQRVGYVNAGTVEFIADEHGRYYFLEMNTRLQVEHPVTELCYGVDLVHWQLRLAAGERLTLRQEELVPRGAAIEVRICAEDPAAGFLPQTGKVEVLATPGGPGVRLDSLLYPGWEVGADYDPLLGKLIVWAPDRTAAIARMGQALREVVLHPAFAAGETDTGFIARHFPQWREPAPGLPAQLAAALALALAKSQRTPAAGAMAQAEPWQTLGAWSNV
jgi:acetyl/propionyl-CoA carboxylase alpha subunit